VAVARVAVVAVRDGLLGEVGALPAGATIAPGATDGGSVVDVLVPSGATVGDSVVPSRSAASTSDELRVAGRSLVTWSPTSPTPCQATTTATTAAQSQARPNASIRRTSP
jgi:hypothetical protein